MSDSSAYLRVIYGLERGHPAGHQVADRTSLRHLTTWVLGSDLSLFRRRARKQPAGRSTRLRAPARTPSSEGSLSRFQLAGEWSTTPSFPVLIPRFLQLRRNGS